MGIAEVIASASHCNRAKVGAVLVSKDNRIIATGYNGCPTGLDNRCEDSSGNTKKEVLHAEQNALLFATRENMEQSTMYITLSPCLTCAAMMVQKRVGKVFYKTEYKDLSGVIFLQANNVVCKKLL